MPSQKNLQFRTSAFRLESVSPPCMLPYPVTDKLAPPPLAERDFDFWHGQRPKHQRRKTWVAKLVKGRGFSSRRKLRETLETDPDRIAWFCTTLPTGRNELFRTLFDWQKEIAADYDNHTDWPLWDYIGQGVDIMGGNKVGDAGDHFILGPTIPDTLPDRPLEHAEPQSSR
ncbi:hypothetical protein AK830_g6332 [Neonectria ditissima]|uniref:Uncharacterized protein n=1 Tax=Neonectria ditissima TaxID=78410 RepID=A0A0P7BCJ8_9HYPO|nr:hypothetical protein AK830_g6332 [Neonectria ditissima]